MKAEHWKYLYQFSNPPRIKARLFFDILVIVVSCSSIAIFVEEGDNWAFIPLSLLAIFFGVRYFRLNSFSKRVISQLEEKSAEMLDYQTLRPYIFYKVGNLQGLYYADDLSAKKSFIILNPLYSEIDYQSKVFLIQKEGKWGMYNPSIGKIVIPCEFYYLKFTDDRLYLSGVKGYYKYQFSLSGTELKKEINDSSKIDDIINKL